MVDMIGAMSDGSAVNQEEEVVANLARCQKYD